MRRSVLVGAFLLMGVALAPGQTATAKAGEKAAGAKKRNPLVVCSTTQVADFARQVVGDRWEVKGILAPGADPHTYKPTPKDAKLVLQADLCLQNGLHLEGKNWMASLAKDGRKPLATCTDGIKALQMEYEGKPIRDPHAWFTPANAAVFVNNIVKAVSQMDPGGQEAYQARARLYLLQLRALDSWIREQVHAIPRRQRVMVTSHDAFNYFCQAYGFKVRTPVGWSTGKEVGGGTNPKRRRQVVTSIRETGVKAIFVETSVNPKQIREIAKEAGVKIGGTLYSDSMGAAGTLGETYIGMMRENVMTIIRALK